MNRPWVVRLERAEKRYARPDGWGGTVAPFVAMTGIDLTVWAGERCAIIGRSGAGKSTLGRCLAGLEPLTAGVRTLPAESRGGASPVQLVFQDSPSALNPAWSVGQSVGEPLALAGSPADRATLAAHFARVGLDTTLLDRRPHQLSGGQRRRILIARALAVPGTQALVLDEPLAGLDEEAARAIEALLRDVQLAQGLALVWITHDLASVRSFAERVLVLDRGRLVEEHPAAEFAARAVHPASRALLDAVLPGARR